ncbi:MAG: FIST N-terminal domain-containing protein [Nitrospiraceae bacterium]
MTATAHTTSLRFAQALTHTIDAEAAGEEVARTLLDGLGGAVPDLACMFFSGHYCDHAERLVAAVRAHLPTASLIGCSGEGIISGDHEFEEAPAVVLWGAVLPGTTIAPVRLSFDTLEFDGVDPVWPEPVGQDSDKPPVLLMLADPFSTPVKDTLSALADEHPTVRAVGGLAGGGRQAGDHRLVLNDQIFDSGLVGCLLSGGVEIHTVISQGCRPIGDRYIVTRSEHNVVYELGGQPALEQLQQTFDALSTSEQRHAHRALHLGLAMNEHKERFERGDFLVRNVIGADRTTGSIAVGDTVQEGQTVQFHLRDAESASEDLTIMLNRVRTQVGPTPLGALMFSCCGRGQHLFGTPHHDARRVHMMLGDSVLGGFFCQGEIGPVGDQNFLHGYTASIVVFAESKS